jgi:hypothetical protein
MRHPVRAMTLAAALLWGAWLLIVGLIHLADPRYGGEFLRMMSSVYPGADAVRTLGSVLLGTVYGFIDGAIVGCLFGLLFRAFGQDDSHHVGMAH